MMNFKRCEIPRIEAGMNGAWAAKSTAILQLAGITLKFLRWWRSKNMFPFPLLTASF